MESGGDADHAADRKLAEKARQAGDWKLLEVEGNVLSIRWPMSQASYEKGYGEKSEDLGLEDIREAGIQISWKDDAIIYTFGKKGDEITAISMETSDQEYKPNALKAARPKYAIEPELDAGAAERAFLQGEGEEPAE